jgi:hypothetical protein
MKSNKLHYETLEVEMSNLYFYKYDISKLITIF